ncbi:MAG: NFACT family protein [Candidatus Micrarchaeota archaeon]
MQKMSSIDYAVLTEELALLEGSFLVRPYLVSEGVYRFKFNSKTKGSVFLLVELGVRANLTKFVEETIEKDPLVARMRSLLENARVRAIKQLNEDRVIVFELDKKESFILVLELFGKGNVILCDAVYTILQVLTRAHYSVRSLKRGLKYVLPPQEKQSVFSLITPDSNEVQGKIVSFLSKKFNLAPFYLEEAVVRAGFSLDDEASAVDFSKVIKEVKKLVSERAPRVYYADEKPVAFSFTKLEKYRGVTEKQFDSFSEALDEYYFNYVHETPKNKGVEKVEAQLTSQLALLQEFDEQRVELKKAGNWVFENCLFVEKLFEELRSMQAKGLKNQEIEAKLNALLAKKKLFIEVKDHASVYLTLE